MVCFKFFLCVSTDVFMFSLIYFYDGYVILYCKILGSNSILAINFYFISFLKHDAWRNSKGNKLAAECKRQAYVSESLLSWERQCISSSISDKTLTELACYHEMLWVLSCFPGKSEPQVTAKLYNMGCCKET